MKNYTILTLVIALMSLSSLAQESLSGTALNGWGNLIGTSASPNVSSSESSIVTTGTEANSTDSDCGKADQNFIPYSELLVLLQNHKLDIDHDPATGELEIDGGLIVGNCNAMLKSPVVQKPINGKPYLFFVEIKRPAGCAPSADTCLYDDIEYIDDFAEPGAPPSKKTVSVAPNFEGFKKCLKDAGALDNTHKIVTKAFNHKQSGITQTEDLAFYSKGPFVKTHGAKFEELDIKGGKCESFEKISSSGVRLISRADQLALQERQAAEAEQARLEGLYNQICDSGDRKELKAHLPQFEGTDLFSSVKDLYRYSILESIKDLKKDVNAKSLEDLDVEKFNEIVSEFYKEIISPLKAEIAALVNVRRNTTSREGKDQLQKQIDEKTKELLGYFRKDYLDSKDYERLKSFASKSPLESEELREGILELYKASNTAFYYSQYNSSNKEIKRTPKSYNSLIAEDVQTEKDFLDRLGELAENPNRSFARNYESQARALQEDQQRALATTQTFIQDETRFIQSGCIDPSSRRYDARGCQIAHQNIQNAPVLYNQYAQSLNPEIQRYNSLASQWGQIEALRFGGQGTQPNPRDLSTGSNQNQFNLNNLRNGTSTFNVGGSQVSLPAFANFRQQGVIGFNQQGNFPNQNIGSVSQGNFNFNNSFNPNPAFTNGFNTSFSNQNVGNFNFNNSFNPNPSFQNTGSFNFNNSFNANPAFTSGFNNQFGASRFPSATSSNFNFNTSFGSQPSFNSGFNSGFQTSPLFTNGFSGNTGVPSFNSGFNSGSVFTNGFSGNAGVPTFPQNNQFFFNGQ